MASSSSNSNMAGKQTQQPVKNEYKTLVIENFDGRLTRYQNGKLNSGYANITYTQGANPFSQGGQLAWQVQPIQIDPAGAVVTDLVMCGKERVESGIPYVYCIGHLGRFYKIQVTNPSTFNPDYDNPVLLTTLVQQSPTFTNGGFIEFTSASVYIGHDKGVTKINYDGTGETFIASSGNAGTTNDWVQNVPRPLKVFTGVLYIGNGTNIAAYNLSSLILTSAGATTPQAQLQPGFPSNTQIRSIDISSDGNYLQMVVTELPLSNQTISTQDTSVGSSTNSYLYLWNGTDVAPTSYTIFPSYSLTASKTFGSYEYTFGYDIAGSTVYNPVNKIIFNPLTTAPAPNSILGNGNLVSWAAPEFYQGFMRLGVYLYGSFDADPVASSLSFGDTGLWKQLGMNAQGTETDIIRNPFSLFVSDFGIGSASNGYQGGVFSVGKVYFSTLETSASTTKYKLYAFYTVSVGIGTAVQGIYQTQTELFSQKIEVKEVRIYGQPWVSGNSFQIDLIGSSQNPMTGGTQVFTAASSGSLAIGSDFAYYNPAMAPTYGVGVRFSNLGAVGTVINKIEIDYTTGGK